jgi:hypothetical protein
MIEQMNGEWETGELLAVELVEHVKNTHAPSAVIAVKVEGKDYQVMVVPKDMMLERKTALLRPTQWCEFEAVD